MSGHGKRAARRPEKALRKAILNGNTPGVYYTGSGKAIRRFAHHVERCYFRSKVLAKIVANCFEENNSTSPAPLKVFNRVRPEVVCDDFYQTATLYKAAHVTANGIYFRGKSF